MNHFEFERITRNMSPQERSKAFNKLSKRKQRKLMESTFDFLEAMGYGRS